MEQINTCPKCNAFCDPDTGDCLICGENHQIFTGGVLKLGRQNWYSIPVELENGKTATLTFFGLPFIETDHNTENHPFLSDTHLEFIFIPREIDESIALFTIKVDE